MNTTDPTAGPEFVEVERRYAYGPEALEILRRVHELELEEAAKRLGDELSEAALLRIRIQQEDELVRYGAATYVPRPPIEFDPIERAERELFSDLAAWWAKPLPSRIAAPCWAFSRLFLRPDPR